MMKNSIIWIIGLVIAITSGLTAMGAIAKSKAPELAIILSPTNGFAAEKIAANSIKTAIAGNAGHFPDDVNPKTTEFARSAFIAEPVVPEAIAILGIGEADQDRRQLMNKSLLLSRRQPLITAWMIADSGAREDLPALLHHYDTMLRTSTSAASVIIPVMADSLADDNFIAPYASLLAKGPPWAYRFWDAVVRNTKVIGNAARLREMLYNPNEDEDIYRDASLIGALASNQQFEKADSLYQLLVGDREAGSLLRNSSFATTPKYPPIDWQLFSTGEYGAVVTNGNLALSAIRNSGGLLARQLIKLPPAAVTLDIKPSDHISDNTRINVSLNCAEATQGVPQTIRIPLQRERTNLQIDNSKSGCSYYWLDINGRASETGDGFDVKLNEVNIFTS
ncbi:MAG: hypothetical protein V7676_05585 [Parasphingorhabdus sp.]|uniref:hypothetical protein n=1 Tax=Parasphingorhabdus sp. TaxID=2709688 RepID=UPI0030020C29